MSPSKQVAGPPPTVSVIMATYNRSNLVRLSVQTVLWQTYQDWELLVVGDACTDDTEAVVRHFGDPRIRFINLEPNCGEQSGPNNVGVENASGRYVAFLNHDDFWLPDHLALALERIEDEAADIAFSLVDSCEPDGSNHLLSDCASGRYEPMVFVPASCWLVRRGVAGRVGPWRSFREIYNVPSQDWLFRAWRAGCKAVLIPRITVVIAASGKRRDSYKDRAISEHEWIFARIRSEPDFRERELTRMALSRPTQWLKRYPPGRLLEWSLINAIRRLCVTCGFHPEAVKNLLRYRRRGGLITRLRRLRGLEPLPNRPR